MSCLLATQRKAIVELLAYLPAIPPGEAGAEDVANARTLVAEIPGADACPLRSLISALADEWHATAEPFREVSEPAAVMYAAAIRLRQTLTQTCSHAPCHPPSAPPTP